MRSRAEELIEQYLAEANLDKEAKDFVSWYIDVIKSGDDIEAQILDWSSGSRSGTGGASTPKLDPEKLYAAVMKEIKRRGIHY